MSEVLFPYYERELLFVRKFAQDFARRYPAAAGRLLLDGGRSADPHIERLIESFALLTARVQHKLDDEFPELTDALLSVLYPHYLSPIPSMAIVQFDVDPNRAGLPDGFRIEPQSLLRTQPINDLRCKYRTCYPVTLWPVELTSAALLPPPFPAGLNPPPRSAAALTLRLQCQGGLSFADLSLDRLRLFLAGDSQFVANLYELLFNHTIQVVFRALDRVGPGARRLEFEPADCLGQVGFEREEGLLPYPNHSFLGYRLLTEFFSFPSKFQFLDLGGFREAAQAGFGKTLEVIFFLDRSQLSLEQGVDPDSFRFGCTPIVNLFEQLAEPIRLTRQRYEYRVLPDVAHPQGLEVYSVDTVSSADPNTGAVSEYQPFYSFRHAQDDRTQQTFWYAARHQSIRENDAATDVHLRLVDLDFDPRLPGEPTLAVRTTCTNRNLPAILQRAGDRLHFELESAAPLAGIRCPVPPTLPLRPPTRRGAHWRLISHLSLNHLSLTDPVHGRAALQEILRLYDFSDPQAGQQLASVTRHLIEGIVSVSSRRVVERVTSGTAGGFVNGVEVALEFDEEKYLGTSVFLFASVLERFIALYASINSFTQLVGKTRQAKRYFKKWPPRVGEQPML